MTDTVALPDGVDVVDFGAATVDIDIHDGGPATGKLTIIPPDPITPENPIVAPERPKRTTKRDLANFLDGKPAVAQPAPELPRDLANIPDQPPSPVVAHDDAMLPGKLTQTSYRIKRGLPFKRYAEVMTTLAVMHKGHQWWIGDALNDGEEIYGAKFSQALNATDYSYGTLRNLAAVCKRFPAEKRNAAIPFTHYVAAMALASRSPAAAVRLVEHARDTGLSSRQLREESRQVERQLDEREQAQGIPSTRAQPVTPLDPPRLVFGKHRPACGTCTCPVLEGD